ncbi:MAG: low molecular weight protein-tyrosine-phosphatase [Mariprofundus sp.]|nr:low molecular weight protein-tyrosine-phosphatase [Mariprofundus sp.]
MFSDILVVCIGNICRSPMAEALLKARAPAGVRVHSAGIGALVGEPADPASVELMQQRGIDITAHMARQLTAEMVCQADLILVMEDGHQQHIHTRSPAARGKVHSLGKWGDQQISDPYKKSPAYFASILMLIEQGVDAWADKLWK